MFQNYLAAALRNLVGNKVYAGINIVGLAMGFAVAMFIALFVRDELTYERWIPESENIYRLMVTISIPGAAPIIAPEAPLEVAAFIKQDMPSIPVVASIAAASPGSVLRHGTIEATENIAWADAEIFDLMRFPVIAGDPREALRDADTLVITRAIARKYFGRDNPIGETMEIDRGAPMRITAVLEDLPSRTHFAFQVLASNRSAKTPKGATIYFRLKPGQLAAVQEQIATLADRDPATVLMRITDVKPHNVFQYWLEPITAIHLHSRSTVEALTGKPRGEPAAVAALAGVGALILLVAVVNFVNLMTARASRRAVEVGVRKATGAMRGDLVFQFIGESLLYVAVGLVIASIVVTVALPAFNGFLGRNIGIFDSAAALSGAVLIVFVVTGVLGGLYPAIILSSFHPARVLKGARIVSPGSSRVRQALTMLQFAALIGLGLSAVVINRQTTLALHSGLRLATDEMLFIQGGCHDAFRNQVARIPGVRGAACAGGSFTGNAIQQGMVSSPDGVNVTFEVVDNDIGFLELAGLKPLAGRFFTADDEPQRMKQEKGGREQTGTRGPLILNETAVRKFGFSSAAAAIGQPLPGANGKTEIVGVVSDFPLRTMRDPALPMVLDLSDRSTSLTVKLDGEKAGAALQAIDDAWRGTNPTEPIKRQFYDQYVQGLYVDLDREAQAFTAFSCVSIFVAALGLFGLAAFTAERRTKEIGVRKAMGASQGDILRLLIWQFSKPVLWANVIAWPVGYLLLHRWLEGFTYHIDLEPWVFVCSSTLALVIAVATVAGHALLVARAEPVAALRYE